MSMVQQTILYNTATVVVLLFYVPIMCFPVKMLSMFITDSAIVEVGAVFEI